ncbi:RNA polymerase sigma factor [Aurantibacillus circumpalustris]|uniref:RNA polymerase sigma factor n=1 Tax=Aurantibacillus circumpalustris TaxID=3036359 RepID=UPI00295A8964|nr:RNA polymerase sigma factor [Aurantibacillus circumpalustris]
MSTLNDQYYIQQVIAGNVKAFEVVVDQYKNLVFSLTLRMLKSREEAEEAAQDTFIKIYKSLSKFKGDSKFSTWIYKITYNTCLDRLKKDKNAPELLNLEEFNEHHVLSTEVILDTIDEKKRRQIIQECIHLLPSEEAFLLTLYYFEEQSLEDISKIMNVNTNNLKIKLFRSRKKMATILKTKLEPEIIDYYESGRK